MHQLTPKDRDEIGKKKLRLWMIRWFNNGASIEKIAELMCLDTGDVRKVILPYVAIREKQGRSNFRFPSNPLQGRRT